MTVTTDSTKTGLGAEAASDLTPYTGFVATRGIVSNDRHATNKQAMTRTAHWARDDITSLQLVLGNWCARQSTGVETNAGGITTYKVAIEYPVGTFTLVPFSGATLGTAADGATLISDAVSVTIPRGAKFFIRQLIDSAGLIVYYSHSGLTNLGTALGEGAEFAVSGITDKVTSGTVTAATATNVYPIAIIATTSRPSIMFIGDSREAGQGDTMGVDGNTGHGPRTIGHKYAYGGSMGPGDRAAFFVASGTKRLALVPYASHIICNLGINDLNGGAASAAATLISLQSIWASVATAKQTQAKLYQCTLEPWTTSADWSTTAGQTVMSWEANRITLNNTFRLLPQTNLNGVIEVADVLESSRNSGFWAVNGTANAYTADGIHATQYGYMSVERTCIYLTRMGL